MRHSKGFTILELIVVIAVVALLATVALPKFYTLTRRAEVLGAQGMVGNVRSALSLQMARGLYQGEDLSAWAYDGKHALYPMRDLLLEPPQNYRGVVAESNERGCWYDDKNSHELVYVLRNDDNVAGVTGVPKKVRWRIEAVYDERGPEEKRVIGLLLQPSIQHQWTIE